MGPWNWASNLFQCAEDRQLAEAVTPDGRNPEHVQGQRAKDSLKLRYPLGWRPLRQYCLYYVEQSAYGANCLHYSIPLISR